MKIGYLHLTAQQAHESGVARYGKRLSQAIATFSGVTVAEAEVVITEPHSLGRPLQQALRTLSDCDILHIQYSKYLGLPGWQKLRLLSKVRRKFRGTLCVTLHDIYDYIYPSYDVRMAWGYENKRLRGYSNGKSLAIWSTMRWLWENHLADKTIMRWLLGNVAMPLVSNGIEAERLQHFRQASRLQIIPHFVEKRSAIASLKEAKAKLGWSCDRQVVTLQGFIFRSKGHQLLLDALSHLPASVDVVFAGGMAPGQDAFERELNAQIERLNLGDRVTTTGYLSESDLELHLAASDLAVCPFQIASASGSLATWISIGRPILAFNLPQIQEFNAMVSDAIQTFEDYSAEALAAGITTSLKRITDQPDPKILQLQRQLSLPRIAAAHRQAYQALLQPAPALLPGTTITQPNS